MIPWRNQVHEWELNLNERRAWVESKWNEENLRKSLDEALNSWAINAWGKQDVCQ